MTIHERICTGTGRVEYAVMTTYCAGPFGRWMYRRGWRGLCLPWAGRVQIRVWFWLKDADTQPTEDAWMHERRHVQQIREMGRFRFALTYLWELRKGYRNNRLERQARAYAGQEP